ncbi:MAG: hypothetical protein P1V81_09640 [Planctomycetota bacterium]|nr:hypothetical protein [Planctomycetota bacterium]
MLNTLAAFAILSVLPHVSHDSAHPPGASQDASWERPPVPAEPLILGEGDLRFRWNSEWLQLPEGREWLGATHGCIVVDAKDRVYLSADTGDAVLVFAPDGTLERSFGEDWGAGVHGLTIVTEFTEVEIEPGVDEIQPTQFLYVAHTAKQQVLKTTLDGEVLLRLGIPTESGKYDDPGRYRPTSVAVDHDGNILVADGYGLSWIHRFAADGSYLDSFGGPGDGFANLRTPHGLWLDEKPYRRSLFTPPETTLLVSDRENHRIARFSLTGDYLGSTDAKSGMLRRPCHLQFTGGLAAVADLAGRVTLLDTNLNVVAQLGDNPDTSQHANFGVPPQAWPQGAFTAPHCARFDSQGDLYVMDWNVAGRVTKLERLAPAAKGE